MITKITEYGKNYEVPYDLTEDKYYESMCEFIDLVKEKGLTIRQAQKLFIDCSDMVLNTPMKKDIIEEKSLKTIADCLNKIATKGVDSYNRTSSTNY